MNIILFSSTEITQPLSLCDERAAHICQILHKKTGDLFDAGILNGCYGKALITDINNEDLHFTFTAENEGEPLFPLALIIGFPRPIQLKRLLRGVSSLGVCEVHLTGTELGEKSYLKSGLSQRPPAQAALIDGAVQAKTTYVPALFFHNSVVDCLEHLKSRSFDKRLTFDNVNPAINLPQMLRSDVFTKKSLVAAIGSERGWTNNERSLFEAEGFVRCSLGKRILRTETAAVVGTALLLTAMGVL